MPLPARLRPVTAAPAVPPLLSASPNPFNPLPTASGSPTASRAHMAVYDVRGRVVATLLAPGRPASTPSMARRQRGVRGFLVLDAVRCARANGWFY
jgi:hypothetical protein